jgi:hypothetical protein
MLMQQTRLAARDQQCLLGERECFYTVLCQHILRPMLAHGSGIIYAPDDTMAAMLAAWEAIPAKRSRASSELRAFPATLGRLCREHWRFALLCGLFVALFLWRGNVAKCAMENLLLGWATWNRSQSCPVLLMSVSLLMCVRLFVANVLPFTSPIFAFLVARSMPAHLAWAGTQHFLSIAW